MVRNAAPAECEHGDPRPGRCALCRTRVKRQTMPSRYADTTPVPPRRRRPAPARRLTSAAVCQREVRLWCQPCGAFVVLAGNVYQDRTDAPVHVTPEDWTEHRTEHHP